MRVESEDMDKPDETQREAKSGNPVTVDEDLILDLNFVPSWARKPPGGNYYESRPRETQRPAGPRRDARRPGGQPGRGPRRGPRPSPGDSRGPQGRGPDRGPDQGRRPPQDQRQQRDRRSPMGQHGGPREPDLPVRVRFVPEQKMVGQVVRRLRLSKRSYPLLQIASLFLSRAESCLVKLEVERGADGLDLFQCSLCRMVALDREVLNSHVMHSHLGDYFRVEEVPVEPPTGSFSCVARCRLSGVLLGPPNHHSYAERVKEVQRARFPGMSTTEYLGHVETLHDEELIEKWKEEQRSVKRYTPTDASLGDCEKGVGWAEVESAMATHVLPRVVQSKKRVLVPAAIARGMEDVRLQRLVSESWRREGRHPFSLALALRAALRHKRLFLFKAGRGEVFVTVAEPAPLQAEHVVDEVSDVLKYLREHPGCTRSELLGGLRPDLAKDAAEVEQVLWPLRWLIDKGHIIEFFDGTLAVPVGRSAR